jgi:FAD/FMN-containing dehydrogenase
MFGLATEVVVRLVPAPEVIETCSSRSSRNLDAACDAVSDMIAARLEPSALEILDQADDRRGRALSVFAAGYPREAEAVLLVELEGCAADVEATPPTMKPRSRAPAGAIDVRRARPPRAQEAVGRPQGRLRRDGAHRAGPVRRRRRRAAHAPARARGANGRDRARAAAQARERLPRRRRQPAPEHLLRPPRPDEVRRVLEAGRPDHEGVVAAGGALTGEHGVGLEKLEFMELVLLEDATSPRHVPRARRVGPRAAAQPGQARAEPRVPGDARYGASCTNAP